MGNMETKVSLEKLVRKRREDIMEEVQEPSAQTSWLDDKRTS